MIELNKIYYNYSQMFPFTLFNMLTRKITYVAHVIFTLHSTVYTTKPTLQQDNCHCHKNHFLNYDDFHQFLTDNLAVLLDYYGSLVIN